MRDPMVDEVGIRNEMRASLMTRDLDPRMTFETFVVGPANRLAAAAARRAADSPGTSYNPLFLYSPSGLGKSHILTAIAHQAGKVHPDAGVVYQTMEGYLDELTSALEGGEREELKDEYAELDILLLDDVQFLSGQPEAQELLLRTLDSLSVSGSQIVLASDRPPAEIDGLDERLLSRFSGGLIVDIAAPEYETRVAIVRRKSEDRKTSLQEGVAEAIARIPFKNVRELAGALNRVLAVQELEERTVTAGEVPKLIGTEDKEGTGESSNEYGEFVSEVSTDLESTVEAQEAEWRVALRETAEEAEAEGFRTGRLRRLLERDEEPSEVEEVLESFRQSVGRLEEIEQELEEAGNPWPDAAATVLKDPERVEEAEALLASARELARPFEPVPDGPSLDDLENRLPPLAVKAAAQLVAEDRPEFNPLFIWDPVGEASRALLQATARSFTERHEQGTVALISASEFAEEFIQALSAGVAGAWRERWWEVDLLLVHTLEALSETERAQDEFFHLFEALKSREARVGLAADRAPTGIDDIDDRLRSRFEGGLVLELEDVDPSSGAPAVGDAKATAGDASIIPPLNELNRTDDGRGGLFVAEGEERPEERGGEEDDEEWVLGFQPDDAAPSRSEEERAATGAGKTPGSPSEATSAEAEGSDEDGSPFSSEKVIWNWPDLSDRIVDE